MSKTGDDRVYQFIDNLVSVGQAEIVAELPALGAEIAVELMRRIAYAMCVRYARTEMYIPAALDVIVNGPRNQQIWDDYGRDGPGSTSARRYSGARIVELASQHSLTTRQVQSIIAEMRSRDAAARQAQLPGFAPES